MFVLVVVVVAVVGLGVGLGVGVVVVVVVVVVGVVAVKVVVGAYGPGRPRYQPLYIACIMVYRGLLAFICSIAACFSRPAGQDRAIIQAAYGGI